MPRPGVSVAAAGVIDAVARGWNAAPELATAMPDALGLSAAIWRHDSTTPQEVTGPVQPRHHILSVQRSDYTVPDLRKDDRTTYSGRLRAGSSQLMEAGVRPFSVMQGRWRVLHIYLPTALVSRVLEEEAPGVRPSAIEFVDPVHAQTTPFVRVADEVCAEMAHRLPLSRLRIDTLGLDVAIQLLRHCSNLPGSGLYPTGVATPADWRVRRACEVLLDRLDDDLSLDVLAAEVGVGVRQLTTLFRRTFGCPPHHWRTRRRVEKAQALLVRAADEGLSQIALACGFASAQHFATVFRRHTGVTPSAYRRERRR